VLFYCLKAVRIYHNSLPYYKTFYKPAARLAGSVAVFYPQAHTLPFCGSLSFAAVSRSVRLPAAEAKAQATLLSG
jgi:hypothetical protein